jgi:ferrous iron transport protein A
MPLTLYPSGQMASIKKIGGNSEVKRFLGSLGFVEGEMVSVISEMGGNMIVSIKGSRVALGKGLTQKIFV